MSTFSVQEQALFGMCPLEGPGDLFGSAKSVLSIPEWQEERISVRWNQDPHREGTRLL